MARFLSDNGLNSVVKLKADDNHNSDAVISDPAFANILPSMYHTQYFSDGTTVPQPNVKDRTLDYIGGKLLGGSSAINGMQYARGTTSVYTRLEQMAGGDPDWGPNTAVKTYKSMENFLNISSVPNPSIHGTSGLMPIRLAPVTPQTTQTDLVPQYPLSLEFQ